MNERESARRRWTRVWRSLAIAGFIASFAVGCASDARNTTKLATDSETHPITSVSPSAIAATQEKAGSEGEVAVAELAPGARALGPADPAAGPAVVIKQSGTVTTTSTLTGPQATTGVLVVGEDAGTVVAPGAVVAPAVAGAPVAPVVATTMAAAATSAPVPGAATLAGETGPAVVPPTAIPVVPTGVATGVTSLNSAGTTTVTPPAVASSAAGRAMTGVAGGPLPTTVGGTTVPSAGVAGPAVVAPTTTATVTNNPTGTVIRVEPAATATTASGVVSKTTSSPAAQAVDGGTAVLGVRTTRPAEESRIGISNRDGATAPVVIETPQRRSVLPWRNRAAVTRVLNTWSPSSQMAARTAMSVYGQPDLLTDRRMVWNDRAPWTRIEVWRDPVAEIEPGVDSGMIVHTIVYPVTAGQAQELRRFNRNLRIDATSGEISVRGVSEAANLLALNLIDEIVRGTRDAEGALQFYRDALRDGVITAYEQRLMFTPRTSAARR